MTDYKHPLIDRIEARQARVAVMGLGYVGLPLAVEFATAGFATVGIDLDGRKVAAVNAGESYIGDVAASDVAQLVAAGKLRATTGFAAVAECDTVSICVPTPLSKTHDPDLGYVIGAADAVAQYVHPGMLTVLESTTYPGTTEDVTGPRIVHNGYRVGENVFVAFSPERVDPGRTDYALRNRPKVIGGVTHQCLEVARAVWLRGRETRARLEHGGGRDGETAREHLPGGEHRAGE
jgi:UDP-N-acetyl-D-glucosamine dehydrogenase